MSLRRCGLPEHDGRDPFNQNSNRSDREKRTTSKGGPVFSKLFRLDRTDPLSFGPKFPESLVEWTRPILCTNSQKLWTEGRVFSVFTVTPWKIKMQIIQYRKSRIWEVKEDKYTKSVAKNQVCAIFYMREILKNVLPRFRRLCMETPCWCHQYCRRKPICFWVFLPMGEFFAWWTHKD